MVDSFRLSLLYHFLRFISGMVRVFSGDKYLVKVSGLNYSFIFAQVTAVRTTASEARCQRPGDAGGVVYGTSILIFYN